MNFIGNTHTAPTRKYLGILSEICGFIHLFPLCLVTPKEMCILSGLCLLTRLQYLFYCLFFCRFSVINTSFTWRKGVGNLGTVGLAFLLYITQHYCLSPYLWASSCGTTRSWRVLTVTAYQVVNYSHRFIYIHFQVIWQE